MCMGNVFLLGKEALTADPSYHISTWVELFKKSYNSMLNYISLVKSVILLSFLEQNCIPR